MSVIAATKNMKGSATKVTARRSRNQTPRCDQDPVSSSDTNALAVICQKNKIQRVSVTKIETNLLRVLRVLRGQESPSCSSWLGFLMLLVAQAAAAQDPLGLTLAEAQSRAQQASHRLAE